MLKIEYLWIVVQAQMLQIYRLSLQNLMIYQSPRYNFDIDIVGKNIRGSIDISGRLVHTITPGRADPGEKDKKTRPVTGTACLSAPCPSYKINFNVKNLTFC